MLCRIDAPVDGVHFGREERRIFVQRAAHLTRFRIRGEPRRQHAAGRESADDRRPFDHQVDEADEVVAHVVERVAARRPRRTALSAQIHRERFEVFGEQRQCCLVAPPRFRLTRNQQQSGLVGAADARVVHPHLAEIDEVFFELVRQRTYPRGRSLPDDGSSLLLPQGGASNAPHLSRFVRYSMCYDSFAGPYSCVNSFLRGPA